MSAVKGALLAVCAVCCISGALGMLSPAGSYRRAVRLCVSLMVLLAVMSAASAFCDIKLPDCSQEVDGYTADLSQTVRDMVIENTRSAIAEQVEEVLRQFEIDECEIKVQMNISDNGSISVSQVDVGVPKSCADEQWQIKDLIDSRLGLYADVYIMEE